MTSNGQPMAPPRSNRMTLENVRRGRKESPDRILVTGGGGVGKTTWAASAPTPIFLPTERGLDDLPPEFDHVQAFPQPESYDDVLAALRSLMKPTIYKTFVIDTVDWLEPLIWRHLCQKNGWDSIESPGYGKGQIAASEVWRSLTLELERLQDATGMSVILLGHTAAKLVPNPSGLDYVRNELKLDKHAAAIIKEWVKSNFFAQELEFVGKAKGEKQAKVTGVGRRVLHTQRGPGWEAKSRHPLPPVLPLSYADYVAARAANRPAAPEELVAEALALVGRWKASTEMTKVAVDAIEAAQGNTTQLARIVDRLRTKVAETEGEVAA